MRENVFFSDQNDKPFNIIENMRISSGDTERFKTASNFKHSKIIREGIILIV